MLLSSGTELAMLYKAAELWRDYRLMFLAEGGKRERAAMAECQRRVKEAFLSFKREAAAKNHELEFAQLHVKLLALMAIGKACRLCGSPVSHATVALMWATPPERGLPEAFALRNVVAACERCGNAKGKHSVREWRELLAALRTSESRAANETLDRLAAAGAQSGNSALAARQKVLSAGRRPRVTREALGPRGRTGKK